MFAWRSPCHLGHRALCEARSIGGARIERSHATSLPSEDRLQLGNRGAVIGRAGRADLPDTVR